MYIFTTKYFVNYPEATHENVKHEMLFVVAFEWKCNFDKWKLKINSFVGRAHFVDIQLDDDNIASFCLRTFYFSFEKMFFLSNLRRNSSMIWIISRIVEYDSRMFV